MLPSNISLIFIVFSAWFPDQLSFTYQHILFMFYISAQPSVAETDHSAVIILTTIFFVIPFVFMVKKTFHRELVINKQFHCTKNTLFCPFHLRLLGWTGVSPKKVVLWIPPTSRQCNCFSILKIDLMKPVIRHRQKLVQEWEIDLAQSHFCKTEFNGVPFLLVQLCPIRDPHAAQLKILWGPV